MKFIIASLLLLSLYSCASACEGRVPQIHTQSEPATISAQIKNQLSHAIIIRTNGMHNVTLEPGHCMLTHSDAREMEIMPAPIPVLVNEKKDDKPNRPQITKKRELSSGPEEPCIQQ